jgi:hypothetical protein
MLNYPADRRVIEADLEGGGGYNELSIAGSTFVLGAGPVHPQTSTWSCGGA